MAVLASPYRRATRQIALLSAKLANNLTFRKAFIDAMTAPVAERRAQMRTTLMSNGITYPFQLTWTAPSPTSTRIQIWAPVMDHANNTMTNVGFTYRLLS